MNYLTGSALIVGAVVFMFGCTNNSVENKKPVELVTTADTISYLIDTDIARSLKSIQDEIVPEIVFAGIDDALMGKEPKFPADQERIIMQAFSEKMRQKQMAKTDEEASKNLAEEKKFLEENGKKEGVVTTTSGLQYIVLKEGDGPIPTDSSKVKVNYEGKLLSGKVFDSSYKRGKPATFGVKQVIKGWTEILQMMKVGSKYKIFVPSALAYGKRGMAHDIGPNMMLIFEIELLGIEK
jgi:FKBP-type peptidyl-prolyl cis-trans isomerase